MSLLIERCLGHGRRAAGRGRARRVEATTGAGTAVRIGGLVALTLALAPTRVGALPIDDPHVGGIGFSGPTTGDLASVYWNPAALGLMRGWNLTFAGTGRISTTTISGAGTDVKASERHHPFMWPPGPGAFAGVSYDVGGDRLALALAAYMPFLDRNSYEAASGGAPPGNLATRYHRISADLRNLALVSAVSIRLAGDLRLGFAPGLVLSTGRMSFAESTCSAANPCAAAEDPAADAHIDIGSNQGIFSSKAAVTLTSGLYFRRKSWDFGASFTTRPLGGEVGGAAMIVGDQSRIMRAPRDVTAETPPAVTCDNGREDGRGCVFADIVYKLPYILTGAVTWRPRPGLDVTAIGRILSFPANDVIDIRLTGATLEAANIPSHIVLYRGFGTVVDTRIRVSSWITQHIRVGAGLRFESSALPARAVSPAAIDNRKFEPTAMILVRPARHVWLGAGYGFTFMLPVTTTSSAFDPTAAMRCEAAGGDIGPPGSPCLLRKEGLARASAAGTYRRFAHEFSLSMTAQF